MNDRPGEEWTLPRESADASRAHGYPRYYFCWSTCTTVDQVLSSPYYAISREILGQTRSMSTATEMSIHHIARSINNTIRLCGRSRPRPFIITVQRAASTKHPRGFVPPTNDDLAELRERVQEFTREP